MKDVYNYSDARAKTNVSTISNSLSSVMRLRPVTYNFKDATANSVQTAAYTVGGDGKEYGLIAQEVEKVLPDVVLTDSEGKKLINYTAIIPILINAIQNLQSEINELKNSK